MKSSRRTLLGAALIGCALEATAGVAVVVGADSGIDALTTEEVSKIFLGKTNKAPNGVTVIPLDQLEGEPVRDEFYDKAAGRSASQLKAYWSKLVFTGKGEPPKALDQAEMLEFIADNPGTIGYVRSDAVPGGVKVVLTLD